MTNLVNLMMFPFAVLAAEVVQIEINAEGELLREGREPPKVPVNTYRLAAADPFPKSRLLRQIEGVVVLLPDPPRTSHPLFVLSYVGSNLWLITQMVN